jgi:hypothetical protein
MARELARVKQTEVDAPASAEGLVEPVYDVAVDELTHEEVQILATEVQKEKQAARNEEVVDQKIQAINSKIAAEEAWDKKVAKVEAKVDRIVAPFKGYETIKAETRKLDEAQLKVYEAKETKLRGLMLRGKALQHLRLKGLRPSPSSQRNLLETK